MDSRAWGPKSAAIVAVGAGGILMAVGAVALAALLNLFVTSDAWSRAMLTAMFWWFVLGGHSALGADTLRQWADASRTLRA